MNMGERTKVSHEYLVAVDALQSLPPHCEIRKFAIRLASKMVNRIPDEMMLKAIWSDASVRAVTTVGGEGANDS